MKQFKYIILFVCVDILIVYLALQIGGICVENKMRADYISQTRNAIEQTQFELADAITDGNCAVLLHLSRQYSAIGGSYGSISKIVTGGYHPDGGWDDVARVVAHIASTDNSIGEQERKTLEKVYEINGQIWILLGKKSMSGKELAKSMSQFMVKTNDLAYNYFSAIEESTKCIEERE